jgi:hypothetical protein
MFRALLYSVGLNYMFRKMGGRRGYGSSYGSSGMGRMRPFGRRW